jgi:hypothetical protein
MKSAGVGFVKPVTGPIVAALRSSKMWTSSAGEDGKMYISSGFVLLR